MPYKSVEIRRKRQREHYSRNRQKKIQAVSLYRKNCPDKVLETQKCWRQKNKGYKPPGLNARIAMNLRSRLSAALRYNSKSGSAVKDLDCSIDELKIYLENQFGEGMTWENYGQWHIDHIIPLSIVDLTDQGVVLKVCHYTNLQPLWAKDNISKGGRNRVRVE